MPVFEVEEFIPVVGLSGYVMSVNGVLKRLPYKKVRPTKNGFCSYLTKERIIKSRNNEYIDVEVCLNGVRKTAKQHRLLAQTFIPNPNNLPQVNHINGDKHDNTLENLEWVTSSENIIHSYETGLACNKRERHPRSKFTQDEIDWIKDRRKAGVLLKDLAKIFSVYISTIGKITTNVNWG